MNLKGVIFDLDGTLADTLPICIHAHRRSFEEFLGRTYSDREIVAMFGPSEEGIVATHISPDQREACLECFLDEYDKAHASCTAPFPGITEALDRLRSRGVRLAIVTGKGAHSAKISLRHLGIEKYFDAVETGAPEGGIKPRCIARILQEWRMPPEEAAYVGDALADVASSREAGVLPLAAAWAATASADALETLHPAALFRTVPDFLSWIDEVTAHRS